MEKQLYFPSLQEIYERYPNWKDLPTIDPGQISPWEVPTEFGAELKNIVTEKARKFKPRVLPEFIYHGTQNPPPDIEDKETYLELHEGLLQCDSTIECKMFEVAHVSSSADPWTKQWAVFLELRREQELLCGAFLLHPGLPRRPDQQSGSDRKQNGWHYSHRLVPAKYRRKGLFGHMSEALEAFVAVRAEQEQKRQLMYLSTAQPDVALAFLKRGYMPPDEKNKHTLQRLFHPDADLFLSSALRPDYEKGGNAHNEADPDLSSLYCFQQSEVGNDPAKLIQRNSMRVRLEKEFPYADTKVEDQRRNTGQEAQTLIRSSASNQNTDDVVL